ncbi:serine/threonine protein kinase [Haloferula luteola]|uniref:Serine/threonine protein kinase n=1 Tax=Haloferula luteola TaxID=595692 RepID=A0A840V3F2_9BACT|nr:protein kinase [Haloferula luteola]MBB5352525.1 serine/threonine protein kinase [Haloferula luteola]
MSEETFIAPQPEHLSELLPAFEFESFIAQGGMGAVYKAKQKSLDRDVAIKILPREFGADPEFRASFETEAKAMAKLNHANLIGVYDYGDVDGMPYIVMEYVDGSSLYHYAWNKVLEKDQAATLAKAICEGLGHAHENGILHRDIKPANILLTSKLDPKIGDFGLAQSTDGEGDGLIMGTPGYTAPEVLFDHRPGDAKADIYGVGVIFHELVTGQRPDPQYQEAFKTCGDAKLDAIWRRATAADPSRRYGTAEEMAKDLGAWLNSPAAKLKTVGTAGVQRAAVLSPPHAPARSATPLPGAVPKRPAATSHASSGGGGVLVRNLVIIAVLIAGISVVWKNLKKEQENVRNENEAIRQRNAETLEAQKKMIEEAQKGSSGGAESGSTAERDETTEQSLARLQRALVAGVRSQLPKGSVSRGESDFLFVQEPMSWHAAANYAEQYGGHLATLADESEFQWMLSLVPDDGTLWVGAGRMEGNQWVQVDGTAWPMSSTPNGVGSYASLDKLGIARAREETTEMPFLIEWDRDGTNPGSLESMLVRAAETQNQAAPSYPPGTRIQDSRRFCVFLRPMTQAEASRLAKLGGGVLASPATRDEQIWMEEALSKVAAPKGLWLGGEKQGLDWTWMSGQSWDATAWSERAVPQVGREGLVFVPGTGWMDFDPGALADGFIVEWSNDISSGLVSDEGEPALAHADVASLRNKAIELVGEQVAKRDKDLEANLSKLVWDLNVWRRGLNASEATRWGIHVESLVEDLEESSDHRIPTPASLAEKASLQVSPDMKKSIDFYHNKQSAIDSAYRKELVVIQNAYAKRLQAIGEALPKGSDEVSSSIARMIQHSASVEGWAKGLMNSAGQ